MRPYGSVGEYGGVAQIGGSAERGEAWRKPPIRQHLPRRGAVRFCARSEEQQMALRRECGGRFARHAVAQLLSSEQSFARAPASHLWALAGQVFIRVGGDNENARRAAGRSSLDTASVSSPSRRFAALGRSCSNCCSRAFQRRRASVLGFVVPGFGCAPKRCFRVRRTVVDEVAFLVDTAPPLDERQIAKTWAPFGSHVHHLSGRERFTRLGSRSPDRYDWVRLPRVAKRHAGGVRC